MIFIKKETFSHTEPLIGHGKIKIVPCIKLCAQDDLMITRN